MAFNPKQYIWSEKWRPKKIDDMVGSGFKEKIKKHLQNFQQTPHMLLHSKTPGTGKTTLAKCIINETGADALILNSSDDRKIEVVREKVKEFVVTQSSKPGLRRIVFLDEFDGMLKASQDALRNLMETYQGNVMFILTCNNINKVIEPLQSRCMTISFAYPEKEEVKEHIKRICTEESMKYTEEGVDKVLEQHYPSIRNCVICLQDLHTEGKDVTPENVTYADDIYEVLWENIKNKKWQDVKEAIMASDVDPRDVNNYFWRKSLDEQNLRLIQLTCRNEKDIAQGSDPKVVFVTSIIEMCK